VTETRRRSDCTALRRSTRRPHPAPSPARSVHRLFTYLQVATTLEASDILVLKLISVLVFFLFYSLVRIFILFTFSFFDQ